ncbi:MAG TPA: alpha/beta hydrolase-fold protein [Solirubrobacter sp.]|nr:alpha/beta hydrolase-fold protein [Solirubrobacter sp.]
MPSFRPAHRVCAGLLAGAALALAPAAAHAAAPLKADVTFGESVVDSHLHGRVYLLVRPGTNQDPLSSVSATGSTMVFGKDIGDVAPGQSVSLSGGGNGFDGVYGFPRTSLDDLPSGTYTVRAFFNVYETAHRSDGSTVDVHFPCGDGGRPFSSPGNLRSAMQTVTIDRDQDTSLALTLSEKLTPAQAVPEGGTCQQGNPAESAHVKQVKLKSELLSRFWGRDMYVAATVLLPWDYDDPANADKRYPVVYSQGHYSTGVPFGFSETSTTGLSGWWRDPASPKLIGVSFRTENPFYDDSYVVNSPNLGPYGDAINDELIPKLDAMFRTIGRPYARALTGGSTGGWITVANMLFRPDVFGSAWSGYPDSLDFNAHQTVDLYDGNNAYYEDNGDVIPSSHNYDIPTGVDTVTLTMPAENHFELAIGNRSRSQVGQWDIWNAAFGAQGANCYPLEPWNKVTGAIDHGAVDKWKAMDMSEVLTDHWATLGPVLRDKLHIWVGTQDTYYLNEGVKAFQDTVERLSGSTDYATFTYGEGQRHGYTPYASTQAMLTDILDYIAAHTPPAGQPDPDLSAARGNRWADVSANSCATRTPAHPAISGDAAVGSTLTADPGAWDSGMDFTYQWRRDGQPVAGGATYTTVTADVGHAITVAVTGTKLGYETTTVVSDPLTVTPRTSSVTGDVSGTVPATLSLVLGAPASFGAFTPGLTQDYTATTPATVVSTAGDAALTVSDPGHLTNGAFSLPSPLSIEFSKAAWSAPVSNDNVTITFKQHIDASDALRTGAYTKTLTFTLATTTP